MNFQVTATFTLVFFLFLQKTPAQNLREQFQKEYRVEVKFTSEAITTDGALDEPAWQTADVARDFWLKWPVDGKRADVKTEIRLLADHKHLHIAATCFDSGTYIIQSLKRDVGYWDSDGVSVILDPANRATNGYFFGTTPAGVQSEALISGGSEDDMDFNWDNRWVVETRRYPDRWVAEMAIPLQILRFDSGQREWGINFIRNDASNGHYHAWTQVPIQMNGTDLGWTGALVWEKPPSRTKGNYNVIPFATASVSKNYEENESWKINPDAGLDAKIGVGTSMNLDLTVNPDFSQVEVDEQVINLTRFDVQLPEKRTFFLENADVFGNYGIPPIRPFFSRKIGLDDNGNQVPILAGARLTGNLNSATRLGLMTMQTRFSPDSSQLPQNFSAFSVNRRLFGRTSVGGYFLNRQAFENKEFVSDNFARNAGMDFSFTTLDGKWGGWAAWHHAFQPGQPRKSGWGNAGVQYTSRRFIGFVDCLTMGENYRAEMGFEARIQNYDALRDTMIRLGYRFVYTEGSFYFYPKKTSSRLNISELEYKNFSVINPDGSWNEQMNVLKYGVQMKNTMGISVGVERNWTNVPVHFKFDDGDLSDCPPLPPGAYEFYAAGVEVSTDQRRRLTCEIELKTGGFYNGQQRSASIELRYRAQPWGNFRISTEYNVLDFPEPFCDVNLFSVTPRIEIFFGRNLNWTTFLQFNNQADNFNINSRLQWRFRPMSDIFLVYTDNYVASTGVTKNKALVLKASYWF